MRIIRGTVGTWPVSSHRFTYIAERRYAVRCFTPFRPTSSDSGQLRGVLALCFDVVRLRACGSRIKSPLHNHRHLSVTIDEAQRLNSYMLAYRPTIFTHLFYQENIKATTKTANRQYDNKSLKRCSNNCPHDAVADLYFAVLHLISTNRFQW